MTSGIQVSPVTAANSHEYLFGINGINRMKNSVKPNHIGTKQKSSMKRWESPSYQMMSVLDKRVIFFRIFSVFLPWKIRLNIIKKQIVRNIAPKKMIIERNKGRRLSVSVIQDDPRIRVPILGIREIMVPVIPIMVKKRKFSHKKCRIVKGLFIFFLQEGHSISGEDSSLPQSGQFFIILLCDTFNVINDLMKTGILRRIFIAPRLAGFSMYRAPKSVLVGAFGRAIEIGNGLEEGESERKECVEGGRNGKSLIRYFQGLGDPWRGDRGLPFTIVYRYCLCCRIDRIRRK